MWWWAATAAWAAFGTTGGVAAQAQAQTPAEEERALRAPPPPSDPPAPPPAYGPPQPPAQPPQGASYSRPAQPAVRHDGTPGRHEHDGFFLRMNLGPAYLSSTARGASAPMSVYGGGLGLFVALGGVIAEDIVLYGDLYGLGASGPTVAVGDDTLEASDEVALSYGGLGVGVGWFLMPANVYLSASVGLVSVSMKSAVEVFIDDARLGPGLNVVIGKEFWVGDQWGIGFAGELLLGSSTASVRVDAAGPLEEVAFTTLGLGVSLSATYN